MALPATAMPLAFVLSTDREIPDRVTSYYDDMRRSPVLRRDLAAEERAALEGRAEHLRAALLPMADGQRDVVARAISDMLGGFEQMRKISDAEAVTITHGYLTVLRERPAWAIVATCLKVRSGSAGTSLDFPPPEPRLNWLAGEMLTPYRARLAAVERLLAAKAS